MGSDEKEVLQKSNRYLRLKNVHGKSVCVVREVYRREVVPCQSQLCLSGCPNIAEGSGLLPKDVTHYVIPDPKIARDYLEIFEDPVIRGVIFTQTTVHSVQHEGSRRLYNRLKNLVRDKRKESVIFHNEFQMYAHCEREPGENLQQWQVRATYQATDWFFNHLAGIMPVVMVTDDKKAIEEYGNKTVNVFVLSMDEYLEKFWQFFIPGVMELYKSITEVLGNKTKESDFVGYLPFDVLTAGIKSGRFIQGFLQVNKSNASQEAFLRRSSTDMTEDSGSDIFIPGSAARNRGIHGDLVAVEILPRSEWKGRSLVIHEAAQDKNKTDEGGDADKSTQEETSDVMPTGRVVGILQRNWREYVACFSQDEETGRGDKKAGKVLVIPWDYRIPKIRISTRQVDTLRNHRLIVRIDHWEPDSQYPNGHFVRSLGQIGDLETEVKAILVENDINVPPFSEAQKIELPKDTEDNPWKMSADEISSRRDLRDSHLIFSIDPKGCEDVDDTLSVRSTLEGMNLLLLEQILSFKSRPHFGRTLSAMEANRKAEVVIPHDKNGRKVWWFTHSPLRELENGNIELGVHIADVTHFVLPGSLSDIEAQSRSTTVYLADRRYDMLPGILSSNLCSLVSGVDRYAVSVIWELSPSYEVLDVWYGRTVIRSQYKLFYEMAQAIQEGIEVKEIVENVPEVQKFTGQELEKRVSELRKAIGQLMKIARHLKARRMRGGALELESVEVQIQLSETKSIENLNPKDHLEVHDTIAECMIFANHWVAKKITETYPNQALLRHHPLPKEEQFSNLRNCASARGYDINTTSNKELAESLDKSVDPADPVVNKLLRTLATQAMSNAEYFCTGVLPRDQFFHYGLALDLYTHFTSPIRRYADVLVHRQLMAAVYNSDIKLPASTELDEISQHINRKHRASQYAQRESQELFQCLYFRDRGTDDDTCIVDAVIFQLRANGVYVFVPRYGIRGPVYLRNKDGQVVYMTDSDVPEWMAGKISRQDTSVTVSCLCGNQTYTLLDHITVRLSLNESWAHASSLRMELVSNKPHKKPAVTMEEIAKQQKQTIIKEVSDAAVEKRLQLETHDLGPKFESLKQEYGQTPSNKSLYNLFESFKETALNPVR